jgi:hypothetical protein
MTEKEEKHIVFWIMLSLDYALSCAKEIEDCDHWATVNRSMGYVQGLIHGVKRMIFGAPLPEEIKSDFYTALGGLRTIFDQRCDRIYNRG